MRIYSYILRLNPEARNVFTESVVEDVEECNGDGLSVEAVCGLLYAILTKWYLSQIRISL